MGSQRKREPPGCRSTALTTTPKPTCHSYGHSIPVDLSARHTQSPTVGCGCSWSCAFAFLGCARPVWLSLCNTHAHDSQTAPVRMDASACATAAETLGHLIISDAHLRRTSHARSPRTTCRPTHVQQTLRGSARQIGLIHPRGSGYAHGHRGYLLQGGHLPARHSGVPEATTASSPCLHRRTVTRTHPDTLTATIT